MIDYEYSMSGLDDLDNDLNNELKNVRRAIPTALQNVGSEMIESLRRHIRNDWYKPWGPPLQYQRRTDTGAYGAMGDKSNMDVDVARTKMTFTYTPKPVQSGVGPDELIEMIQTATVGGTYDAADRLIMPRPFWNEFVEEQERGGIMQAFIEGMRPYIVEAEGGDVEFDFFESFLDNDISG